MRGYVPDLIAFTQGGPYLLAALIFGYLLGSIPFGVVMAKVFGLGNLRDVGSGNIGATNRQQEGRDPHTAVRYAKGHRRRLDCRTVGPHDRCCGRIRSFPRSLLPSLAEIQGRQRRRDISRGLPRSPLADLPRHGCDVVDDRVHHQALFALCTHRRRRPPLPPSFSPYSARTNMFGSPYRWRPYSGGGTTKISHGC